MNKLAAALSAIGATIGLLGASLAVGAWAGRWTTTIADVQGDVSQLEDRLDALDPEHARPKSERQHSR